MPRKYYYGFLPTKFHHIGIEIEFNSAREKRTVHAVPVAVTADTIGRFARKLSNQARNLATRSKISCGTYGEGSQTKYTGSTLKVCCTAHRRPTTCKIVPDATQRIVARSVGIDVGITEAMPAA